MIGVMPIPEAISSMPWVVRLGSNAPCGPSTSTGVPGASRAAVALKPS